MAKPIIFAASILSANFAHLGEETKKIIAAGANEIHFDVMDHHFVPNLTFGSVVCESLRKDGLQAPIDVHLMVTDPESYIEPFAKAGATRITFHANATNNVEALIDKIHAHHMQAGVAFNPDIPVTLTETILKKIDLILIMSVFAGFGGQKFMPEIVAKIQQTKTLIEKNNPSILLAVDGGIDIHTIKSVADAGANFIIMGTALFRNNDYQKGVGDLRNAITH